MRPIYSESDDNDFELTLTNPRQIYNEVEQQLRALIGTIPDSSSEKLSLLSHELTQVFIELDFDHFTAATLRTGRLWEAIIYIIAQSIGVDFRWPNGRRKGLKGLVDGVKDTLSDFSVFPSRIASKITYIRQFRNKSAHPSRTHELRELSENEAERALRYVTEVLSFLLRRLNDFFLN